MAHVWRSMDEQFRAYEEKLAREDPEKQTREQFLFRTRNMVSRDNEHYPTYISPESRRLYNQHVPDNIHAPPSPTIPDMGKHILRPARPEWEVESIMSEEAPPRSVHRHSHHPEALWESVDGAVRNAFDSFDRQFDSAQASLLTMRDAPPSTRATHQAASIHRHRLHAWKPETPTGLPSAPGLMEVPRPELRMQPLSKPSFAPHKLTWAGYGWPTDVSTKPILRGSISDLSTPYAPANIVQNDQQARIEANQRQSPVRGLGCLQLPLEEPEDLLTRIVESNTAHIAPHEHHDRGRHLSFAATSLDHAHRHLFPEPLFDATQLGSDHRPRRYA